jgi:hypothetical protein
MDDADLDFDHVPARSAAPLTRHPSSLRDTGPQGRDRDDRRVADADNNRAGHGGLSKSQRARRNRRERGGR